jgi:hypothetical protein
MDNEALVQAVSALNESVLVLSMMIKLLIFFSALQRLNDNQTVQNKLLSTLLSQQANGSAGNCHSYPPLFLTFSLCQEAAILNRQALLPINSNQLSRGMQSKNLSRRECKLELML